MYDRATPFSLSFLEMTHPVDKLLEVKYFLSHIASNQYERVWSHALQCVSIYMNFIVLHSLFNETFVSKYSRFFLLFCLHSWYMERLYRGTNKKGGDGGDLPLPLSFYSNLISAFTALWDCSCLLSKILDPPPSVWNRVCRMLFTHLQCQCFSCWLTT